MLYEFITHLSAPVSGGELLHEAQELAIARRDAATELPRNHERSPGYPFHEGRGEEMAVKIRLKRMGKKNVITSYSIHYTKLYERCRPRRGAAHR